MTSSEEALRRTTGNVMECATDFFECDKFFRTAGFAGFAYKELERINSDRNFSLNDLNVRLLTEKLMWLYGINFYDPFGSRQHFNDLAEYHVFSGLTLPGFIKRLPQIILSSWYAVYVIRVPWLGLYKEEGVFDE